MLYRNLLVGLALFAMGASAMAYEEPQYRVIKQIGQLEVRDYAPYLVAETRVALPFDQAGNEAFNILAGYIFGKNKSQQKMEMTAPVIQAPASEKIEMTAPVLQTPAGGAEESYVFSFVMPARFTRETLPVPLDSRVNIREIPARTMAALTYSGTWSQSRYEKHEAALLAAVREAGLQALGKPEFARYNSPFTPWFLRRNEVMVEIQRPAS